LKKANPDRVWAGLKIPVHMNTSATFAISIVTSVGNGDNTLFWSDHWLHGCCLEDLAPNVVKCVPPKNKEHTNYGRGSPRAELGCRYKWALGWLGLAEYLDL